MLYDDENTASGEETEVLIIGAGYSGLGMGAQLKRRGRTRVISAIAVWSAKETRGKGLDEIDEKDVELTGAIRTQVGA